MTSASYMALDAKSKADVVMGNAAASAYNPNSLPSEATSWPSALDLFGESMDTTFDRYADELPTERDRLVHAHGALARMRFDVDPEGAAKYTGIYKSGASEGVIRLSLAGEPDETHFSPGFGIKFFIDGQYSANLVGMNSLDPPGGTANYNFFAYQMKTRIANPSDSGFFTTTGEALFATGSSPTNQLGCEQPALYTSSGVLTVPPLYPRVIYLVPNSALNFSSTQHEFRADLVTIPNNTLLYTLVGLDQDCDTCDGKPCSDVYASGCTTTTLGTLTSTSQFVASPYVDKRIFFQHSRIAGKSRGVCKFAVTQDDSGADSTVLPEDPTSTCSPVSSGCSGDGAVVSGLSAGIKCPRDAYITYPAGQDSTVGIAIGAAIGGIIALALILYFGRRYLSNLDKDLLERDGAKVEQGDFHDVSNRKNNNTAPPASYARGGGNYNGGLVANNPKF